ncbi:leucyl aminopeptidase [Litorimonas taeanensis]|uniref:Probable cytosol aminopeptidase n=1 Tax=Litorimonas taeanensis TaxID=568099 RepID=A0A420WIF0_9PROT|nr:leucyl aminopeptidase [Litorimonas taeanensis]RKQ70790.1 leucyl aminopeptidase [Litorimonas taeanensis]
MKVTFTANNPIKSGTAIVFSGQKLALNSAANAYRETGVESFDAAVKAANFKGDSGSIFETFVMSGTKAVRLMVVGTGAKEVIDYEMAVAKAIKRLSTLGETTVTLHLNDDASAEDAARAVVGARLAAYRFDNYKTDVTRTKTPQIKTLKVACANAAAAKKSYENYHGPVCDGTLYARDLVNMPPNDLFPKNYAAKIKTLEEFGLKVEIIGEKRMKTLGMNAFLGVGVGSERESQFVIMKWNGGKKGEKPTALIGKGVTFDAGGISLKPGAGMWDMKGDMGGSAAVVGAMLGLAKRNAKANVVGLVGLVENMPDGKAQNPGDIVTSMSGQTIEVQNTDAEGRLVLCDVLHYTVSKIKPAAMIDLATLTGAIIVSLGHEHAGLFSNDDTLANQILAASETTTEKTWRLPLSKAYDKLLDSPFADMKNIGGREAGSITAAQFLQRFVGKDTPWAHLDIAGTGMKNSRKDPRETTFGTGFGARLLNRWIADNYEG